jgi:D-alanyl-D-alanine carboxypeptidase/D-alanyl-D-alanine-endopeptidase (penicillin-binding protein 4)
MQAFFPRTLFVLLLVLSSFAAAASLPASVADALKQARIPTSNIGIVVWETDKPKPILTVNADASFNPASTMKLLTTAAALDIMGPNYSWKTALYTDGTLNNGVLDGNLYLKGYGDPQLTIERFWLLLRELRSRGVREIRGDLVLDQSYFALESADPARFDGQPRRAYNAVPSALMVNFNSTILRLTPLTGSVASYADPLPANTRLVNDIKLDQAPCGEWRDRLDIQMQPDNGQTRLQLNGKYAADCGEKTAAFNLGDADQTVVGMFRELWPQLGGQWRGNWRAGSVPATATPWMVYTSPPLADAIRNLNKFSNNVMARNLFLTLGAEVMGAPATPAKSIAAVKSWLAEQGLKLPELVLENGAGLSRIERISPDSMARLLVKTSQGALFSEFESSLPIMAVDGTMKSRGKDTSIAGHAHLKTGTLEGVKTIAGYVLDPTGRQFAVVFFINHANAAAGGAAQDALLDWVYGGR